MIQVSDALDKAVETTQQVSQNVQPAATRQSNLSALQSVWNIPAQSLQAALDVSQVYKMKHGMFAGVPIICKADDCPYKQVCLIDPSLRIPGQRCPMEAGAIITRFEAWCKHFLIDLSEPTIKEEDLVDASLIRDLVDNEIQTLRAENRIAINADFIGMTISQIDNKGKPYYEETVTPEAEYKLTLQDKRYKILQLLNSTRKDKAAEKKAELNPSQKAVSIFKKVAELIPGGIDNIDFSAMPSPSTQPTQPTQPEPVANTENEVK